jgi:hypothetical protein
MLKLVVDGRVKGAYKPGRSWLIPEGATILPAPPRPSLTIQIPQAKKEAG